MAPVFCFHFLRISNKALTSFKGGELITLSSSFLAAATEGTEAAWAGAAPSPHEGGGRIHMKFYLLMYTVCFPPSERLSSALGGFYGVFL